MRTCIRLCSLTALVTFMACGGGRAEHALSQIIIEQSGGGESTTEFSYDDEGRLAELERSSGQDFDFVYGDDGNLRSINGDDNEYDLVWSEDRLVSVEEDETNDERKYSYDDSGRLSKAVFTGDIAFGEVVSTTDYNYEDGEFVGWNSVNLSTIAAIETESTVDVEVSYDDNGRMRKFDIESEGVLSRSSTDVEYVYDDDGRLLEMEASNEVTYEFSYDDSGRIESVEGENGVEIQYEYDDSISIRQLKLSPSGIEYSQFFDLEGRNFPEVNLHVLDSALQF